MNKSMKELEQHLEPRVSRVEAKVESALQAINTLTTNIQSLSNAVQKQGEDSVAWREKMMLAVERAGAPRQTNWQLLVTLAGFVLALGAVMFTPLNWRILEVQRDVDKIELVFVEHSKLTLHPVGASKVEGMEKMLVASSHKNAESIRELDDKLQREFGLINSRIDERVLDLTKHFNKLEKEGSPNLRERVAIMESAFNAFAKDYDAVHPLKLHTKIAQP
jgi:hypothetical protein